MNRRALAPVALAVLGIVAGLAFAPAFGGQLSASDFVPGRLIVGVAAAVLVPLAAVALCSWRRWPAATASLVGLGGLVLAIAVAVRPGRAVFSGPYHLLTTALPADSDGPGVAAVAALAGLAALTAALVMHYSRAVMLSVLAPLGCLGLALALDAAVGEPPAWYAAAVVAPIGLIVAAQRSRPYAGTARSGRIETLRRALPGLSAVAVIGIAAILAPMLAPSLPGLRNRPADVRELVAPPLLPKTGVSPLQQYLAWRNDLERVRLTGTSSRQLDLLRLATLDRFDGLFWTTDARYRRAGHTLSDKAGAGAPGAVDVDVRAGEVKELAWLPQPGDPLRLDAAGLGVDESTGDLAVPVGGTFPNSYRVTGRPALRSEAPSVAKDEPEPRVGPVDVSGRPVPTDISVFALRARTARTGYLQLATLLQQLRAPGFFVDDRPTATGGHGYFSISNLLKGAAGIHAGTSEQYASTFAVMARVLGYDARVVVGFRPKYSTGHAFTVEGPDVYAWAEVRFGRSGWVTFDPTPTAQASLSRKTPPPPTTQPPPPGSPSPTPSKGPSAAHPSSTAGQHDAASTSALNSSSLAWAALLVGGLVLILSAPPAVKAGRRRRRRGRPPARAVYGAWQETLDRIIESGIPVRGRMTGGQVTGVAPPIARPYVAELAAQLDRAGYAPEVPDAAAPKLAWANAAVIRTELRRDMHPVRRLLAWIDPRPLWRR